MKKGDLVKLTPAYTNMGLPGFRTARIIKIVSWKPRARVKYTYARVKIIYPNNRKGEMMNVGLLWLTPLITPDWAEYIKEWRKKKGK